MSEHISGTPARGRGAARPRLLTALAVVLFIEMAALAVATMFLLVDLITVTPDSIVSAIALLAVTAIATAWLAVMAGHTLRGRSWIRGATITVQVLVIAIAVGAFQGAFARPDVGWLLLAPAIAALVLVFAPSVVAATRRDE